MKLLLDENLSDRLVGDIQDLFPGSSHVKAHGLTHADDALIWEFAAKSGFTIVSKDSDFHQRSILYGHPPKLVYLRIGNCPTGHFASLLWASSSKLKVFGADADASLIILT